MKIIGRKKIFSAKLNKVLNNWLAEMKTVTWKAPSDVRQYYPKVKQVEENKYIYKVINENFFVEFIVAFKAGVILITNIYDEDKEFIK